MAAEAADKAKARLDAAKQEVAKAAAELAATAEARLKAAQLEVSKAEADLDAAEAAGATTERTPGASAVTTPEKTEAATETPKKKQNRRQPPPVKVTGSGIRVADVFKEPVPTQEGSSRNPLAPGSNLEDILDKSKMQDSAASRISPEPCPSSAVPVHEQDSPKGLSSVTVLSFSAAFGFGTAFAVLADLLKSMLQKRNQNWVLGPSYLSKMKAASNDVPGRNGAGLQLSPSTPTPPSPGLESGLRRRPSPTIPPLQGEKPPPMPSKLPPPIPGRYARPASPRPPPLPDTSSTTTDGSRRTSV